MERVNTNETLIDDAKVTLVQERVEFIYNLFKSVVKIGNFHFYFLKIVIFLNIPIW
jgi:hypothetical protein